LNSLHSGNELPSHVARASVVNRTHRIVREQARQMQEQKQKSRSLWLPLGLFSVLVVMICYGIWATMDANDFASNGVPDASGQMILFLLWSLPVTMVVLGLVWFKRNRGRSGNEVQQ
jgi:hypothetical protein